MSFRGKDVGKIAGLYDLEHTIGKGHYAVVRLARHVFTGERVAVKVIDKTKLDPVSREHLFQEVRCMKLVQHPHIVRLYEVIDTQTKLYLILELADGGDMYDYIMKHETGLNERLGRKYFRQIVQAISYCHKLHVVHRDLKPENVVFFEKLGVVKLTDFGFSNKFLPGQKLETSCGSLAYSAPEILLGDSYDPTSVDVWSLGAVLYMLVSGYPPFQEANDSETLTMIMDCKLIGRMLQRDPCDWLIGRMLQRDPSRRASLQEIESDPWLNAAELGEPLTAYVPLVSRQHLSEEEHALIVQKIANGGLGSREDILDALDRDEYNYITATYFLLAERRLRAARDHAHLIGSVQGAQLSPLDTVSRPTATTPGARPPSGVHFLSPQEPRQAGGTPRPLSMPPQPAGAEGSDPGRPRPAGPSDSPQASAAVRVPPPRPRASSPKLHLALEPGAAAARPVPPAPYPLTSNLGLHGHTPQSSLSSSPGSPGSWLVSPHSSNPPSPSLAAGPRPKASGSGPPRRLHAVRSSPQLLEIHEDEEEDEDEEELPTPLATRTLASPALLRRMESRRRGRPARTTSCSSSDASDDEERKREREAVIGFVKELPRRDSHDDSSDSAESGPVGRLSRGLQRRLVTRPADSGGGGGSGSGGGGARDQRDGHGGGGSGGGHARKYRAKSASGRLTRTGASRVPNSRSLNCISELHVLEFGALSPSRAELSAEPLTASSENIFTTADNITNIYVHSGSAGGSPPAGSHVSVVRLSGGAPLGVFLELADRREGRLLLAGGGEQRPPRADGSAALDSAQYVWAAG
ncbi:SNF-related serine/threonine-protein kinase [Amphibalanus amphitrite]|uniref:SNF-related serine/threonine-protein kinase n=1 Tax=Amphibalanus amphitrite TaxID=1232801 RepID=A0A6A4X0Y1_AMPAM|nr:SNF-related serine/threonine-protein kinase [Amphibalanus amphitrite]